MERVPVTTKITVRAETMYSIAVDGNLLPGFLFKEVNRMVGMQHLQDVKRGVSIVIDGKDDEILTAVSRVLGDDVEFEARVVKASPDIVMGLRDLMAKSAKQQASEIAADGPAEPEPEVPSVDTPETAKPRRGRKAQSTEGAADERGTDG